MKRRAAVVSVLKSGETLLFFLDHLESFNAGTSTLRFVSGAEHVIDDKSVDAFLSEMGLTRKEPAA